MIPKYQFYVSFNEKLHTAANKATSDCSQILSSAGYEDFSCNTSPSKLKLHLYPVFKSICQLLLRLKPNSLLAIQYPLLTGNGIFRYFLKFLSSRGVKCFCIIHDIDQLRNPNSRVKHNDIRTLNSYDCLIVHNDSMKIWLRENGVDSPMVSLNVFDYLSGDTYNRPVKKNTLKRIVFAGNLSKSTFIYTLGVLDDWYFNVYGPGFLTKAGSRIKNICWNGSMDPEELVYSMDGCFGLIWDGEYIDKLDDTFGNYLKFNNPHKFSLYLAAGLPVIAPAGSAIADFIRKENVGILVDNLLELSEVEIDPDHYYEMKNNALRLSAEIRQGKYVESAVSQAESILQEQWS